MRRCFNISIGLARKYLITFYCTFNLKSDPQLFWDLLGLSSQLRLTGTLFNYSLRFLLEAARRRTIRIFMSHMLLILVDIRGDKYPFYAIHHCETLHAEHIRNDKTYLDKTSVEIYWYKHADASHRKSSNLSTAIVSTAQLCRRSLAGPRDLIVGRSLQLTWWLRASVFCCSVARMYAS